MDDLKIYNIDEKIAEAAAAVNIDEETGEITGQDEFNQMLQAGTDKVLSTARYLATREPELEAMKALVKNLRYRIQAEEKRQVFFRSCLVRALSALDKPELSAPDILVKLKKLPPSVVVEDETKIPEQYVKTEVKKSFDLIAMKAQLKAGTEVPGASLKAGYTVAIR